MRDAESERDFALGLLRATYTRQLRWGRPHANAGMLETTLITEIELMEAVVETAPGSTPIIRYRVTAMSDAGRLVLWLSESAAKQLGEFLSQRFPADGSP
jgi:hypothetical protein